VSNISSIPTQTRDQFVALSPPWLATGLAEKFGYTIGLQVDLLLEKAYQAQTIRIPGAGDVSQIPYLCQDRNLVRGPAESTQSIITRLQQAFQVAKLAGSRIAVLRELQAYLQNLQPGVSGALPTMTIVAGNANLTTWSTQYIGDAIGAPPVLYTSPTNNWNWDGKYQPWRSWLILYMSSLPTGQASGAGQFATATAPAAAGVLGQSINGVWSPGTSGPAQNPGSVLLTNMTGANLATRNVGQWLTTTSGAHGFSNQTGQILELVSPTSCYVSNPAAPGSSTDMVSWSIAYYPYIAPGPVWGTPGYTFGQGESNASAVPVDLGSSVGGVWQPTTSVFGNSPTLSWGLSCSAAVIQSLRSLVQAWKSATTYYPQIIIAFDGGTGAPGSAFSPYSSQGNGNPNGTFGSVGESVGGVWVPSRLVSSPLDCYCAGTGIYQNCSVENVT
jgi:hypothetical protein